MAEPTIDDRVVAYLEGRLDAAGLAALRDELAGDAAARRRFVLIMTQIGAMRDAARGAEVVVEPAEPAIPGPSPATGSGPAWGSRWRIGPRVWAAAAVVAVAGVAAAAYLLTTGGSLSDVSQRPRHTVAIVMSADDVSWASPRAEVGESIEAGRVTIDAGELEFESMQGATVRLRGPCDVEIVAADRVRVYRGRVSARIAGGVSGFTVDAPHGIRVVDLGTAFDVTVGAEQSVEVYCSEGRVRIDRPEVAGAAAIELRAGLGVRYAAGDSATPIAWLIASDERDGTYVRRPATATTEGPWKGPATVSSSRIGTGGPTGTAQLIAALAFELPVLESPDQLSEAELRVPLMGLNGDRKPAFNADVYGVAVRDEPGLLDDEFYMGPHDAKAARLIDDAIRPSAKPGELTLRGEGLDRFVRSAYGADGKPRGRYLVLRLNPDKLIEGYDGYVVAFRENETETRPGPRLVLHRRIADPATAAPIPQTDRGENE